MRVGYCVEGNSDKWLLHGLRNRWCPGVELVQGHIRGAFTRREIPKACAELRTKGVDVIILLRDANDEPWRDVANGDQKACSAEDAHLLVIGVCDRNVECWFVADRQYAATETGLEISALQTNDPKAIFNRTMGITRLDDQQEKLISYVMRAPLHSWLGNRSFEHFYDQLRVKSNEFNCRLENLRESGRN
jgi:hypothetical protein